MQLLAKLLGIAVLLDTSYSKEILEDNIAIEQEIIPHFVLPAPLHTSSSKKRVQRQNYNAGIIGNLLPLEPREAMPTISTIDVSCNPGFMRVNLKFDSTFPGIIYSKGHYGSPECTYVSSSSSRSEYNFEIRRDYCGTKFSKVDSNTAYIENVIIIQNEPGIQEIWDTARSIRCMLGGITGRRKQTVSTAFNVGMLDQKVVSFRSDSEATASMDIQVGRGPFAPSASGLVKIGELMTMVVAVKGPKDVDLIVRQCVAHDGTDKNSILLSDEDGCIIKKKILGSWQKSSDSVDVVDSVISYSHFQAFKFPDKMDVYIECEIDLCNGGCPVCSEDQVGRRKRAVPLFQKMELKEFDIAIEESEQSSVNQLEKSKKEILSDSEKAGLRLARRLRVLSPDDITIGGDEYSTITLVSRNYSSGDENSVCMRLASFVIGLVVILLVLVVSSILTAVLCIRVRTIPPVSSSFPPDSSFHAFSTVSGKNT